MRLATLLIVASCLGGCAGEIGNDDVTAENAITPEKANGKGGGTAVHAASVKAAATGISYNGGPVMLGTPNVYFIWYGSWANDTATTILPDFMSSLGDSPYLLINTTYSDSSGQRVSGNVAYAGSTSDNYSRGTAITDADVETIVQSAIGSGALPLDGNAVYFVLTSADVTLSGYCSQYCGWHQDATLYGVDVKYSFVGNPAQCPSVCSPYSPSPNGNLGADGMASIIAHELEETLTDPDLNAWYDSSGESADKCAWKFGSSYQTASGAWANMRLGDRDYLIQEQFDAADGKCELSLPGGGTPPPPALSVKIVSPSSGTVLHASGPLDIVASVTGSSVKSVVANWTAPTGTSQFTMSQNSAGNWELSTTMSSTARAGSRQVSVTATDASGHTATSSSLTLSVQ